MQALTEQAEQIRRQLTEQENHSDRLCESINQLLGSSLLHLEYFTHRGTTESLLNEAFIEGLLDLSFHMMNAPLQSVQLQELQQLLDSYLPRESTDTCAS